MDKNAIKKFAVLARTELIARVSLKGVEYGITEDNIEDANADSVCGKVLTADEKKQRQALIAEIHDKGYKQVMEEVAYTWFNRFSALRFMEVNGYLPSHVRVFTDEENNFKPQIITEAIHLDLDGLDMEKVYELKEAEKTEELYKYLLIVQCNALNKILPGMFQKIADYTELLLPDNLLREGSVIQQMIELIPEDDWKDAVQIIGWLYQYYNSEKKDDVFAALKKNVKITKENIPAATQLFTPDWIVRYMVENSLGRLWLEGHPDVKEQLLPTEEEQSAYAAGNRDLEDAKWHYYLEEAEQEPEVQTQLAEIRKEYAALTPDQLKVIDPCSGSGHILAYMFDVLIKIYESYGYTTREAVASIVENNLYGLDIDDRAAQLAYFAVMMKARQYDRRFFSRGIQPHVYAIVESNHVDKFAVDYFCNGDMKLTAAMDTIISELHDAKEYGSILTVTPQDWSALYNRFAEIAEDINMSRETALKELLPLVQVAEALAQKYDAIITNPPYAGAKGFNPKLRAFINNRYAYGKYDIFAAFIMKCINLLNDEGKFSLITPNTLLFNPSYAKLRQQIAAQINFTTMVELGGDAFEVGFGTVVYSGQNKGDLKHYMGRYYDVTNDPKKKVLESREYLSSTEYFLHYDNCKFMYKLNEHYRNIISNSRPLGQIGFPRIGMQTNDNLRFVREWFEVNFHKFYPCYDKKGNFPDAKWFPMVKGGGYRKWYGNITSVVNWANDGYEIKQANIGAAGGRIVAEEFYFLEGLTWTHTTYSQPFSIRYMPTGVLINVEGPAIFELNKNKWYVLACLNSAVAGDVFEKVVSSIHYSASELGQFPVILDRNADIDILAQVCVDLSHCDWDSVETSWDFQHHPLLRKVSTIAEAFAQWQIECDNRFNQLKANEEELNRIFIDIYGLQGELTPEVEDKDVTVRKADLGRDIRSFISYAVGCMFGRYSIYRDGLVYAGGKWNYNDYEDAAWLCDGKPDVIEFYKQTHFMPDEDNIIPICDDEYFTDDIVGRFVEFLEAVYGTDTLDENLKFIADALGGKGQPKDVIRNYFLNDFYSDHCKIYQKRPIYWLFDSGKKNGFKALIYMHRYQPDTIARIRTDYVHEQQARYRTALADLEQRIANASTGERVKLNKKLTTLQAQDTEIKAYEEKIHHLADQMISIDLDDGVKKNYAIFQDVLAKIK